MVNKEPYISVDEFWKEFEKYTQGRIKPQLPTKATREHFYNATFRIIEAKLGHIIGGSVDVVEKDIDRHGEFVS